MSKKIVFFGNERLATGVSTNTPVLRLLLQHGYKVDAIICNYTEATSRKEKQLEIEAVAHLNKIPVLKPKKLSDAQNDISKLGADIGVLVAYGKMVPQSIINIFPKGIINLHPSLLPKHRGPTPIESVILNGENKTGVSIMKLTKEMDAGAIYRVRTVAVDDRESKQKLADKLINIGAELIIECLPGILDDSIKPTPQKDYLATYDALINKQDGAIDWSKPAELICRQVKAYEGWPTSKATIAGTEVTVTSVEVKNTVSLRSSPGSINIDTQRGHLTIVCGEGSIRILRLKPAGKTEMSAADFIRGYANRL